MNIDKEILEYLDVEMIGLKYKLDEKGQACMECIEHLIMLDTLRKKAREVYVDMRNYRESGDIEKGAIYRDLYGMFRENIEEHQKRYDEKLNFIKGIKPM